MEFGELTIEELERADLSLPPDNKETERVLKQNGKKKEPKVYVGCPSWGEKGWVGTVYPPKTKAADFLHFYSRQFNTIELNSSFYRTPAAENLKQWHKMVPDSFRFCPKIPQMISHIKRLKDTQGILSDFIDNFKLLEENLGMIFLQLPPNFGFKHKELLESFLAGVPKNVDFAIEYRDPSWFEENNFQEAFDLLEAHHVTAVITDVAGKREVLHQRLTTPKAFIRFNGYNLHPTDYTRMDEWVMRIKSWLALGLHELYFMVHTPDYTLNADLSNYMVNNLNKNCGLNLQEAVFINERPK